MLLMESMFSGCENLNYLNFSSLNIKKRSGTNKKIFYSCHNLKKVIINKNSFEYFKNYIDEEIISFN